MDPEELRVTSLMPYRLIRSRRRTLILQIRQDAELVVRAPNRLSLKAINSFIRKKIAWIERKQREVRESPRERYQPCFSEGSLFYYLGRSVPLVLEAEGRDLKFDGERFLLPCGSGDQARSFFETWYRNQARQEIVARVKCVSHETGLKPSGIRITGARTRWGSCGPSGTLNFSWRLIMAPLDVIDYVITHELVHLVHRNHSPRFWGHVEKLCPGTSACREWLRKNGRSLMAW